MGLSIRQSDKPAGPRPLRNRILVGPQRARRLLIGVRAVPLDRPPAWPTRPRQAPVRISLRMSSTRQAVMRGPSLTGFG